MEHPWLFARCCEIEEAPDGFLDLWAREHYKSTIITYGKTIQDILASHGDDPLPQWAGKEITVGIFSHTRPIAKKFLNQIKSTFETNVLLKEWFPDIVFNRPDREAPRWSEDAGLIFRRKSTPKEATVEAWGIVDGQPTGAHFDICIYDDLVTLKSVHTPEMMQRTTEALRTSFNLGARGGRRRMIGTRYHYNDTYRSVIEDGVAVERKHTATVDGQVHGDPVLLSREELAQKRIDQGPYVFSCQMLQNPKADETQGFKREWMAYYDGELPPPQKAMNTYLLVDPASSKKKGSDYTAAWVIGLNADGKYYVLDMVRDRLNLSQRAALVFDMHRRWGLNGIGYETYGMQADIEHIQSRMTKENYRFDITPLGGTLKKEDRIKRLIPVFEQGQILFPAVMRRTNYEGTLEDLVNIFIEQEFTAFPVSVHDDMLDALSRILDEDLSVVWPKPAPPQDRYDRYKRPPPSGWAA